MDALTDDGLPQLQTADVVLSGDSSPLARIIQFFDDTPYHHAALALDAQHVAEALLVDGICSRSLEASLGNCERALVRRFRPEQLAKPGGEIASLEPVAECAKGVVGEGHRYASEDLLTLSVLVLTREVPPAPSLGRLAAGVLDATIALLRRRFTKPAGKHRPQVCSGLVAYCFAEAEPRGFYSLHSEGKVRTRGGPVHPASARGSLLDELLRGLEALPELDREAAEAGPASPISLDEIETNILAYLDEVARREPEVRTRGTPARAAGGDVLRAAVDFVRAFGGEPTELVRTRGPAGPAPARALLEGFAERAATLMTPGDLLRTLRLMDIETCAAGAFSESRGGPERG